MTESTNGGRERAYQELRESEELHRVTLSNISDAVLITDDDGAFTFICPNVDVIFGYAPDEVRNLQRIGRLLGEHLFDVPDLKARGEIRNIECEITAKSGARRTVLVHAKSVSIKNGTVLYCCRDITELKHREEDLRTLRLELAHASRLALVGQLMASITHEVKQPLTAVIGNASAGLQMMAGELAEHDVVELRSIFKDIIDEGHLASDVIDRLAALIRKRPLVRETVDVNMLAAETLRFLSGDARRRHVTLRTDLDPALPKVTADRVCLQHVLLSLALNAMEAMDELDPNDRHLVLQTRRSGADVELAVSDTGRGIAPDHLAKVFDPFFTTKNEGLGLGLAIAQSIVEAHDGRIWAEDRAGRGATFYVCLPPLTAQPLAHA
jgi:PAS domain S-box-containing protein